MDGFLELFFVVLDTVFAPQDVVYQTLSALSPISFGELFHSFGAFLITIFFGIAFTGFIFAILDVGKNENAANVTIFLIWMILILMGAYVVQTFSFDLGIHENIGFPLLFFSSTLSMLLFSFGTFLAGHWFGQNIWKLIASLLLMAGIILLIVLAKANLLVSLLFIGVSIGFIVKQLLEVTENQNVLLLVGSIFLFTIVFIFEPGLFGYYIDYYEVRVPDRTEMVVLVGYWMFRNLVYPLAFIGGLFSGILKL